MSGQPTKTSSDINKFRNEYMETLNLQASINDMNLQANKTYLLTGQLPPSTQMMDTRTNAEKLKDVENMKHSIASELKPIAEPQFAYQIVSKVMNSPLNVDNSLFRFLAQRASSLATQLKDILPYGIAGDENDLERIVEFIKNMYSSQQRNFQSTKSYLNSMESQQSTSRVITGNDIDLVIQGLGELIKNVEIMINRGVNVGQLRNGRDMLRDIGNNINTLKMALPTTTQIQLLMEDIKNPQFNNPYPNSIGPQLPQKIYNRDELDEFFKFIEKLPRYNEAMSLIGKIKQYLANGNYKLVNEGILNLNNMFSILNNINGNAILAKFSNIKQRQEFKENKFKNLMAEQSRDFIRRQTEEQKDASRAQKVYIVNPEDDAVWTRTGAVPMAPPSDYSDYRSRASTLTEPSMFSDETSKSNMYISPPSSSSSSQSPPSSSSSLSSLSTSSPIGNLLMSSPLFKKKILEQADEKSFTSQGTKLSAEDINQIKMDIDAKVITLTPEDKIKVKRMIGLKDEDKDWKITTKLIKDFDEGNYIPGALRIGGLGIKRRVGRPRGSGLTKVIPPKIPNFVGFGINEINQKQLENGIVKIRRNTRSNYPDMPSKRVSSSLQSILKTIVGGGVPKYNELSKLDEEEKEYLHKLVSRSNLTDRLSVPAPSKDKQEADIHTFEILKGQLMSGNDSVEMVKKFKLLIRKLSKQGLLPRKDVDEMLDLLLDLNL